jgi:hypothetical protein
VNYRPKTVISLFGPIRLWRAYYHGKECGHGHVPWDQQLGLCPRKLTPAAEELAALAGTLTDFEEASHWSLRRMCGFTLSESTVERVTEEAGLRLKQVLDEGQTVGENKPYSWHRDANGQTCAYVSLDATGVPQQGPGGVLAECRMVYVGKVYNPVCGDQTKTSKPAFSSLCGGHLQSGEDGLALATPSYRGGLRRCPTATRHIGWWGGA